MGPNTSVQLALSVFLHISLLTQVASTDVGVIILDILGPIWSVLGHCQLQPWLHVPIVMNNSSTVYLRTVYAWVVSQSKNVPGLIQGMRQFVEGQEARRKCPKLPKNSVFILEEQNSKMIM